MNKMNRMERKQGQLSIVDAKKRLSVGTKQVLSKSKFKHGTGAARLGDGLREVVTLLV